VAHKKKQHPSLRVNAVSNWCSLIVNIGIGFCLTPFIIKNLGDTGYGIWTLVGSFVGYYGLLNLGVGSAITRYIARYSGQGEQQKLDETFNTALVMFSMTGCIACGLSFVLAGSLAAFFEVPAADVVSFKRLIWIIGITTGIGFPAGVFSAAVTAREHFVEVNVVTIVRGLLRAGLVVLFVNLGWGVVGVGLAPLCATLFAIVANMFLFKRYGSDISVGLKFANRKTLKMLLVYGGITTIIAIADILRSNIDSVVIGKFVSLDAVGVYGVAMLLLRYMTRSVISGLGVLGPRFAVLDGVGHKDELNRLFLKSLSIAAILSFGVAMLAIVFGRHFILWWAGEEYSRAAIILYILVVPRAVAIAQNPGIALMYALKKHQFYAVATIAEAIANITLSLILVKQYGIVGVALGTMVSMLIVKIGVMPLYVSGIAGLPVLEYAKSIVPPAIIAVVISFVAYYVGIMRQNTLPIAYLVFAAFIAGITYFSACYCVVRKINSAPMISLVPTRSENRIHS
jgi:O-antigen/teichoic acid export membrane protein